jgi:hypothetical protein
MPTTHPKILEQQKASIGMVTGMHMQFARQAGIVPTTQKPRHAPRRESTTITDERVQKQTIIAPVTAIGISHIIINSGKR